MSDHSLFDIIGPVMVGPSSSHTAGAVRLGALAKAIAGKPIREVECVLYNSFAQTYKGHGTDRGLLAGLLGYEVDDERIRDVFVWAEQAGLKYNFTPWDKPNKYSPNTVVFHLVIGNPDQDTETLSITGHSVGGGNVYVSKINDYNVSLRGDYPTLILFYKDQPGMIWKVTKIISQYEINIASLQCARRARGGQAFMHICLDTLLPREGLDEILAIPHMELARNIPQIMP